MISSEQSSELYHEEYRPRFHFTARRGWLNDPNGLVYYQGEYHLFYQHNPAQCRWGTMHWGHAVSRDLVHWQEKPIALFPQDERFMAYSGSAVVDKNNTAGFKTGDEDVIVLIYTRTGKGQALAYSNDRGVTWQEYSGNPVYVNEAARDVPDSDRDPKVFWHEPSARWIMVLYRCKVQTQDFVFFASPDLKTWTPLSISHDFHECPDLFELPIDGDPERCKWVMLGADGRYVIGEFDGQKFTPETFRLRSSGPHFYASQTWNDIPQSDGQRIQLAWMRGGVYPEMPFSQQMTFPCELSLRTVAEGVRLCRTPVREIELLHQDERLWQGLLLAPGDNPLSALSDDLLHITLDVEWREARAVGFNLRGASVLYLVPDQQLTAGDTTLELPSTHGRMRWEILLDRTSLELFVDNGRTSISMCITPDIGEQTLALFARGGTAKIHSMRVASLKSAWESLK